MRRRDLGIGLACGLVAACSRKATTGSEDAPRSSTTTPDARDADDWQTLSFPDSDDLPEGERALLYAPSAAKTWPTLVALHGRGEAGRGLDVGARGWRDEYAVLAMHERLRSPPLTRRDVGDFLTEDRLAALNRSLAKDPFQGLALACPYTPILADPWPRGVEAFSKFVIERLLPRVAAVVGRPCARATTGIDGVSMGGRLALLVGLSHPEAFASIGALQPAIQVGEAETLSSLAARAMERSPFALRLVSSEGDPFLAAVRALSKALDGARVPHGLVVTRGPHDYVWNRGPGACEMLAFHERVLRGLAAP